MLPEVKLKRMKIENMQSINNILRILNRSIDNF